MIELDEIFEPFIVDELINNFCDFPELSIYDDMTLKKVYTNLKTYRSKAKNNIVNVKYKEGGVGGDGRIWSKGVSLQNFPALVRNTLAFKNYIDIDLSNCSFKIINNYLIKNNLPNKAINDYIENREERLEEIQHKYHCNRKEAKERMIIVCNSKPKYELLTFMKDIQSEMKSFVLHIENNDLDFIKQMKSMKISKSNKTDDYGSIVTFYYQQIERTIINEAVKFSNSHNYKVGCIIHDGFLLEKKNIKNLSQFLDSLTNHINKKFEYNIEFLHKPFDEKIKLSNEIINMDYTSFINQQKLKYNELKFKFEEQNHKILNPPCYITFDCQGHIHRTKLNDITKNYIDWKEAGLEKFDLYVDTSKPKTFIENYVRDPFKKTYNKEGFYFDKSSCPKNIFNTFLGFKYEDYYPQTDKIEISDKDLDGLETIQEFYKFIVDDNSNKVNDYYEYIIQYFAHTIFNPMEKTKVHICFKGDEGCGKNLCFEFIGKELLGEDYYLETSNPKKDIFGDWNSIRERKKLIVFNEADPDESKYFYEQLKDSTTNNDVLVKQKFFDDKVIKSYEEMGSTTNNEIPIKISETNRRFALFECCQEKRSRQYYGNLYFNKNSIMKNKNVKILFLDYLKSKLDLDYDFSKIPKTKFYNRSLEYSNNSIYDYFKHIGSYISVNQKIDPFKVKGNNIRVLQNHFYQNYKLYMEANSSFDILNLKSFKLELDKHQIFESKHSNNGKNIYFMKDTFIKFLKSKNIYEELTFEETSDEEEDEE